MIRDPTRRVIERFQELMGDKAKHEDIAQGKDNTNKDVGAMIAELRPTLLNASEAASKLSPSRALCLGWSLENMHLLDAAKLYVLKEIMSVLLEIGNIAPHTIRWNAAVKPVPAESVMLEDSDLRPTRRTRAG